MKDRINKLWSLVALVGLVLMASCGSEDDETPAPAPTLTVNVSGGSISGTDITAEPGDEITFDWNATIPGGFNVLRVTGLTPVYEQTRDSLNLDAGATSASASFTVPIGETLVGSTITLNFQLVDDADLRANETWTITVESPSARAYTAVLLSAPLGDLSAKSFFSSSTGATYSPTDVTSTSDPVSSTIDFGYYFGSVSDGASLASPLAYSELPSSAFSDQLNGWNRPLNSTSFKSTSLGTEQFVSISTWADIDDIFDNGSEEGGVITGLVVNQVIAFETDTDKTGGSKRGVILVKSITPGDGVAGEIEIEVVVQEDAN